MNKSNLILLPGLDKQFTFLKSRVDLSNINTLVMGPGTANIGKNFLEMGTKVEIIVEDYDSLINTKLEYNEDAKVSIKLMDFERTDYEDSSFDLVYIQGSIFDKRRKKIIKEIKRIAKNDSFICLGEIVKFQESTPPFVTELFDTSNIEPLTKDQFKDYYLERNFEIVDSIDLSFTLREYYSATSKMLNERIKTLNTNEKSYYKKLLNQISHESNAYLKLGANKYFGFHALLLKKK